MAGAVHRLLLLAFIASTSAEVYRSAEDDETALLAKERAAEECENVDLSGVDQEAGRKALEGSIGETNLILEALKNADGPDQIGNEALKEVDYFWVVRTAGPFVVSQVLVLIWLICCWTACPGCRCCRCCERKRQTPRIFRLIVLIIIALLAVATVGASLMALRGQNNIRQGMDSVVCTTARVLDGTLSGDPENNFIGLLPLLEEFDALRSHLDDGSKFVSDVEAIVTETAEVEQAEFIVTNSLKLLEDTLALPANKDYPGVAEMGDALDGLSTAVAEGVAKALAVGREEVEKQFTPQSRADLQGALDEAVTPLKEAKTSVMNSMKVFLEDDFGNVRRLMAMGITVAIFSIAAGFALVGLCGCSAGTLCTFSETRNGRPNKGIPYCACATWCCGWMYAYLAFFLGGLMLVITVPLSATCLVMDDLNSQMVQDITPGLGADLNMDDDQFVMIGDIIDGCFSKSSATGESLTDIVYFKDDDGKKVTLTQKIKNQTSDPINSEFVNIEAKLASQDTKIATNPNVEELKRAFRDFENETSNLPFIPNSTYRCDIFQVALGAPCDVKDMAKVGPAWVSDCVQGSGATKRMESKAVDCNAVEFGSYIGDWSDRLDKVLVRMDDAAEDTTAQIVTDLRALVEDALVAPVTEIVTKAECSFLKNAFRDVITGFCYQGVVGFRFFAQAYVVTGALTLLLIIILYIVWRVSIDNVNCMEDAALQKRRQERAEEERNKAIGTTAI